MRFEVFFIKYACYNYVVIIMKDKKNGFTLIELLIVIAVIGLLGTIVTINLSKTLENTKTERCNDYIKEVEEAACVYVGLSKNSSIASACRNNGCDINLSTLVEEGLLDEKTHTDLKNTEYCQAYQDKVNITFNDGEKICNYIDKIQIEESEEENEG